jgi:hypothetical protein
VFVAAFVGEGDVWSLSHLALALSGLGLLVAICTFAFCVWALRRERVRRRSQVRDAVWEWAGGMANKDEVEKLKEAVSDLSERLTSQLTFRTRRSTSSSNAGHVDLALSGNVATRCCECEIPPKPDS